MDKELNLDFSGGPESWFDFWHTHVDWDGSGNKDWKAREKHLRELINIFFDLKLKLKDYPNDFQVWIMIDEDASEEDCVYIHTKNPNANNFPLTVKADKLNTIKNKALKNFIESLEFEKVRIETSEGYVYYLYDKNTGINLV